MEDILRKKDYAVIVCDCRSDPKREKDAVDFLLHRRVDGLINMATDMSGAHRKSALAANLMLDLLGDRENPIHRIVTLSTELTEGTSVHAPE